jgi:hypothetical protein
MAGSVRHPSAPIAARRPRTADRRKPVSDARTDFYSSLQRPTNHPKEPTMNATLTALPARATALVFAVVVTLSMLAGVDALAQADTAVPAVAQDAVSCILRG